MQIVPINSLVPKGSPDNSAAELVPIMTSLISNIPTRAGVNTRAGAMVSQIMGKA